YCGVFVGRGRMCVCEAGVVASGVRVVTLVVGVLTPDAVVGVFIPFVAVGLIRVAVVGVRNPLVAAGRRRAAVVGCRPLAAVGWSRECVLMPEDASGLAFDRVLMLDRPCAPPCFSASPGGMQPPDPGVQPHPVFLP